MVSDNNTSAQYCQFHNWKRVVEKNKTVVAATFDLSVPITAAIKSKEVNHWRGHRKELFCAFCCAGAMASGERRRFRIRTPVVGGNTRTAVRSASIQPSALLDKIHSRRRDAH
jgi:hypothetical protein